VTGTVAPLTWRQVWVLATNARMTFRGGGTGGEGRGGAVCQHKDPHPSRPAAEPPTAVVGRQWFRRLRRMLKPRGRGNRQPPPPPPRQDAPHGAAMQAVAGTMHSPLPDPPRADAGEGERRTPRHRHGSPRGFGTIVPRPPRHTLPLAGRVGEGARQSPARRSVPAGCSEARANGMAAGLVKSPRPKEVAERRSRKP